MTCSDGTQNSINTLNKLKISDNETESPFGYLKPRVLKSIVFLLCNDTKHAQHLLKLPVKEIIKWIENNETNLGVYEAIELVQNFRVLRFLTPQSGNKLCDIRKQLFEIADSLTIEQTSLLKSKIGGNLVKGILEEQLIEWDVQGIINISKLPFNLEPLSNALNEIGIKTTISTKNESAISNDYYEIIDKNDIGWCIIINQNQFYRQDDEDCSPEELSPRAGSECDVIALHQVFTKLGFTVKVHSDVAKAALMKLLQSYAKRISHKHSMIIIVLLSHGSEDVIYAADSKPIKIEDLEMLFQGQACSQLLMKPKLFIVQACQGKEWQRIETDGFRGEGVSQRYGPQKGDALIAWSTVRGFASFRDRLRGSWFIQALCRELASSASSTDFLDILTRVNLQLRSQTHKDQFMVPWVASSLCKKIKFPQ